MKPRVSTISLLIVLLMWTVSGCGTGATGPFFQKLQPKEQGVAIVYLFANWQIGATSRYPIKANGEPIVKLVDGWYYPFRVPPGAVTFEIDTALRAREPLVVHAESGQTYFVQAIRWRGSPDELKLLSEEEAIHLITPCRLILEPCFRGKVPCVDQQ